jgi:protein-S-isoprenylcysteine O-methyltransferase Ste14
MRALELKIPPPAVAAAVLGIMWIVSAVSPAVELPAAFRTVAASIIGLAAAAIVLAAALSFRRAKTTINPMKPETTSNLVTSGIYGMSRNPMYLGLLVTLIAWALLLSTVWAFLGPLVFLLYIRRFQIGPEEKVLAEKFGASYADYAARVRRWL